MRNYPNIFCLLTALFLTLTAFSTLAQDTLITVKGDILPVKLVEINKQAISYKSSPADSAALQKSLALKDVFIIKYQSGQKQVFAENLVVNNQKILTLDQLQKLGKTDARKNYDPKGHAFLTGAVTMLSPPVGLILVLTNRKPYKPSASDTSDKALLEEKQYVAAYQKEAKKIKKDKALKGFVFGLGAYMLVLASIAESS